MARPDDNSEIALLIEPSVAFRLLNALMADWFVLTTREDIRFLLGLKLRPWSSLARHPAQGRKTRDEDV
jgi:hypothetical protein